MRLKKKSLLLINGYILLFFVRNEKGMHKIIQSLKYKIEKEES